LLTGWGRTAPTAAHPRRAATVADVVDAVRQAGPRGLLVRGLGRSYGDAGQNAGGTVLTLTGVAPVGLPEVVDTTITVPAATDLDTLLRHIVPRGWFVPVTPGTRQVTLGGALAADVHGKNHHRDGSLSAHVTSIDLVDGTGTPRTLTPADELFWAVPGGMGLSGIVTSITLRLRPITSGWMTVRTERTTDLDHTIAALDAADHSTYSVAWVDSLARGAGHGRGIVSSAEHTPANELSPGHARDPLGFGPGPGVPALPWAPPGLLNRHSVRAFNTAYLHAAPSRSSVGQHHAGGFFHPLDAVRGWNRLYGRQGFVQYQFLSADVDVVRWALARFAAARAPSFLTVLKRFGPGGRAPMSFPRSGWTLAVDLPAALPGLAGLLDQVDERVAASGGRVYLAKDARLRPELLPVMYPELDRWRALRAQLDPRGVFVSDLSRRLSL
jgi:decaprenylphospho-beta-D-ribofuranose 2-oxidase